MKKSNVRGRSFLVVTRDFVIAKIRFGKIGDTLL
jgi:hypothetical protein